MMTLHLRPRSRSENRLMIIPSIVVTLSTSALLFAATTASAQTLSWELVNEYEPNSIHAQTADAFIADLAEASSGEIAVTAHHGASLGYKSLDQFDAVGDGAVQLATSYAGAWAGIDPIFLLPSLPFLAPTVADTRALYEAAKPYYAKVLEDSNQVFLFATPWPASGIWANEPIDAMEKLKGLKIRTYDANGTVTLKAAGASPIQLSWADVVPQLATNGIDAVLTSADGGAAAQFWEHLADFTEVNYAMPLQIMHMNRDTYDDLSDVQREIVDTAATDAEAFGWELLGERVAENYAEMREHDMTIAEDIDPAFITELSDAGQEAIDDWKSKVGDAADTILDDYAARRAR